MNPEQIAYVKERLAAGLSESSLTNILVQNGYTQEQVAELIAAAKGLPLTSPIISLEIGKKEGWSLIKIVLVTIAVLFGGFLLLSPFILASLNDARDTSNDAITKITLNNFRLTAELYYDSNNLNYNNVCAEFEPGTVVASCLDSETKYRLSAELLDGTHYCVSGDSDASALISPVTLDAPPNGFDCR